MTTLKPLTTPALAKLPPPQATLASKAPPVGDLALPAGLPAKSTERAAYAAVFARWGVTDAMGEAESPCTFAQVHGPNCLPSRGGFADVARQNLPAILELAGDASARYQVALLGLSADHADVVVGNATRSVPRSERETRSGR